MGPEKIAKLVNCCNISVTNILSSKSNYSTEENTVRNKPNNKTVYCFSQEGRLIAKYLSIRQASEAVKIDRSLISKCCSGDRRSASGYFWSFSPNFITPEYTPKTWKRYTVIQYDLNNDFVAKYNSLSEAIRRWEKHKQDKLKSAAKALAKVCMVLSGSMIMSKCGSRSDYDY